MNVLTGALFGALVVYLGGWFMGQWVGNFSLLLTVLTFATFLYWLAERFHFKPQREAAASALETQDAQRRANLSKLGIEKVDGDLAAAKEKLLMQPWWLDWTAGLFPVILIVFVLRSFLFEPFKIPSGSMVPTLLVGDLILVNKFHYGIRLPVLNTKLIDNKPVARGDVVVFRYPPDPRLDYIKRVVAIPGDEVSVHNQVLSINGQAVATTAKGDFYDEDSMRYAPRFEETLGAVAHGILVNPKAPTARAPGEPQFPFKENCRFTAEGVACRVPQGHYFVLGDNRDNSQDSRFWGFVPDENLVGRAFFIWMNFGNFGRIGSFH
jgi:signal peptidase I